MKRWFAGCSIVLACLSVHLLLSGCTGTPTQPAAGKVFTNMPAFDPPGGKFLTPVSVTISSTTSGATIYYTTDGSAPSNTHGLVYTAPVLVASSMTLQACAYSQNAMPSLVTSGVYTIAGNEPPVLSNAAFSGSARPSQMTSATITCTASDSDGFVASVTVDLTAVGGIAAQPLTKNPGNQWSWTGSVRPVTAGRKEVPVTATDDQGSSTTISVFVDATTPVGSEKWSLTTQGPIQSSPAIAQDGTVYVGSSDRYVYAIRPDGTLKWRFWAGAPVTGCPAVGSDGMVYFGVAGALYAVKPDGHMKWTAPASGAINGSVAIGVRGMICVGTADGTVQAVDANGAALWQVTLGGGVGSAPSIESSPSIDGEGTIYIGAFDGNLYAMYPSGRQKWRFPTNGAILASPAIGQDGTIYVGSTDGKLYAIRPDGTKMWESDRGAMVTSSAAVAADGTLYVGSSNVKMSALDAASGALKWEFITIAPVASSPTVASDGTIYFGCTDGTVYALNSSGKEQWHFSSGAQIIASAVIGQDGTVYIGAADRQLYAIAGAAGPGSGPWPTYRGNLQRTGAAASLPTDNILPVIGGAAASGLLVQGRPGKVTLSCDAFDPDMTLQGVTADLSAVKGGVMQPLTKRSGDGWSWSGMIAPDSFGTKVVRLIATDSDGATRQATATIQVLAAPQVANLSVQGNLVRLQDSTVLVSCTASDPDGLVETVVVDLSPIGGNVAQTLGRDGDTQWTWSGVLNPKTIGLKTITFTATDSALVVTQGTSDVTVSNAAPTISGDPAKGRLIQGDVCDVTVSCTAKDMDGAIASITADLSTIGGSSGQSLRFSATDGKYTWSGQVTPPQWGSQTITFTATDNDQASTSATANVTVLARPSISNVYVSDTLVGKTASPVTVSCIATDPDGSVQTPVQADLSAIGGLATQVLNPDPDPARAATGWFTWSGTLTPPTNGSKTISFHAVDQDGLARTLPWQVTVANALPGFGLVRIDGQLVVDQDCVLTVSCAPTDLDGTVIGVTVDLSAIGGASNVPLQKDVSGSWGLTVTVHPTTIGEWDVIFTATDDSGGSSPTPATVLVLVPPSITGTGLTGTLTGGMESVVTIRCHAIEGQSGLLLPMLVDLSAIGGSAMQVLDPDPANVGWYTWTGKVTPPTNGVKTIIFKATNAAFLVTTASYDVTVQNGLPGLRNESVGPLLVKDQACTVTVLCEAYDPDGTVAEVTVDLSGIGGLATQPLTKDAGGVTWSAIVTVSPPGAGDVSVSWHVKDNSQGMGSDTSSVFVRQAPTILDLRVDGRLTENAPSAVIVSCQTKATDVGATVAAVAVNLAAIGGLPNLLLTPDPDATKAADGWYSWSGTLTPPTSGDRTITCKVTDNYGVNQTLSRTITVSNAPLSLSSPLVTGTMAQGVLSSITVSCKATALEGTVTTVTADLSQIPGLGTLSLAGPDANGIWTATTAVTPSTFVPFTVGFTATDNLGGQVSLTVHVGVPPVIGNPDVVAVTTIAANAKSTITVSCTATDADPASPVQLVVVDLSWLGGSSAQVLTKGAANTWSWTGPVYPSSLGDMVVSFTAVNTVGLVATGQKTVSIGQYAPLISDVKVTGVLQAGQASSITITCRATDMVSVTSMSADLSAIGGPNPAVFPVPAGIQWTWTGTVTPISAGSKIITITAAGTDGLVGVETVSVPVNRWNLRSVNGPVNSPNGPIESSPAVASDGTIYFGSADGNLYAVNSGGTIQWKHWMNAGSPTVAANVQSSPAIAFNTTFGTNCIYAGSGDNSLYAISTSNVQLWRCVTGGRVYSSPAVSASGSTVYVGSDDKNLYAVDAASGNKLWTYPTGDKIVSSPALSKADGTIYVGSYDSNLYAINPGGTKKWNCPVAGLIWSSPAVGADGTVYVAAFSGTLNAKAYNASLYAVKPDDGSILWTFDLGGMWAYSSPVIGPDGVIYIGADSDGGKLYAIDAATHTKKWECLMDGFVRSVPLVGSDSMVYVGTNGGTLYAVSTPDGQIQWTFHAAAEVRSSPALGSDGTLYVASYDWNLYAITASGQLATSSWPMFRSGLDHRGLPN